jgi:hypothetical protein
MSYNKRKHALLEAHPGFNPNMRFLYLQGYKHAFTSFFEDVLRKNVSVDYMAYPKLFIARHPFEIGLKANIYKLKKYTKNRFIKISNCHNITKCLTEFNSQINAFYAICNSRQVIIENTDKLQFSEYYESLNELVYDNNNFKDLGIIDDGSIKFKYTTEKVLNDRRKPMLNANSNSIMKNVF